MVKNNHRVNARVWKRWGLRAQAVFNGTYEDILHIGPALFLHPLTVARKLSKTEFSTIAWNAAWTAADQMKTPGAKLEVTTNAA